MSVQNYWEKDFSDFPITDQGGPPVGDPFGTGQTATPPAGRTGPPYTVNNPPPPSDDPTKEWILNPTTGEFELRPRGGTPPPPPPNGGFNDPNNRPSNPPAGYTYEWDAGSNRWYLKPVAANAPPPGPTNAPPITSTPGADGENATAFDWPGWESAGPFQPRDDTFEYTPFSYDPYTESSWEDAEKEPGYGASRNQLRKQIEAGAAHRGMLRSGMTIGDLYSGLDSLGQQNFANYDNRRFRNYSANRDGAFQSWSGNLGAAAQKFGLELGVDRDIYDRKAADIDKGNNFRYNVASSQFQDMLSRWQERVRSLTSIATAGANS